jgi:hypothetical protein
MNIEDAASAFLILVVRVVAGDSPPRGAEYSP